MAKQIKAVQKLIVVIIALVIFIPCSALLYETLEASGGQKAELYYIMADGRMKPLSQEIAGENREECLQKTLQALQKGPTADGARAAVPQALEMAARLEGNTAIVALSEEYQALTGVEAAICRASIVWTLTSLDFVENVRLEVAGEPLYQSGGTEYGLMNRQNVMIDAEISADTTEYAIVRLYFANAEGIDLAVEERLVEVSANQAREKAILELLIAGPLEEGHKRTIPADTKVRDVTTTGDGTCYVNLSQDFFMRQNGTEDGILLTVYSIVNSLCELDQVDKVQFLFEGEKLDNDKGKLDFKTPFTMVNSLKTVEMQ